MKTYATAVLDEGLRLIHLPSSAQVVYCGFCINAGGRNDGPAEEGMAHLCEHMAFKGTIHRSAWHILNRIDSIGGELNAFTTKHDTVFYCAIPKEHVERAVELLGDMVFCSTCPERELAKEKRVIADEIESYNDNPAELVFDEFDKLIFRGHPLGRNILGTAESLEAYSADDVLNFMGRFYTPANTTFFAYGDVDFNRLRKIVGAGRATARGPEEPRTAVAMPSYEPTEQVIDRATHQAHVIIGTRTFGHDDKRRPALSLLNNILGGPAMNSRLNMALRERRGLVYTVESAMTTYEDTGLWAIYFGCDPEDVDKCKRLAMEEMERLIDKPLSHNQLKAAKRQIKGQLLVGNDNGENLAIAFGRQFAHYGSERHIGQIIEELDALTPQTLQEVAADVFQKERLTTLVMH